MVFTPMRTSALPGVRGLASLTISIVSSSLGVDAGMILLSAVKLGILVTSARGRREMVIWPWRPKMGDHE